MVDVAARSSGYVIGPVYHGTDEKFDFFDPSKVHPLRRGRPLKYFFAMDEDFARTAGGSRPDGVRYVLPFYLKGDVAGKYDEDDQLIPSNADHLRVGTLMIAVRDPSQIKSAEAVVRSKDGTIVPLSKRFNVRSRSLINPRQPVREFPYEYARYLKEKFPRIWAKGGNIRGNDTFRWWTAWRRGDRSPAVVYWHDVTRPAWIARHYRNNRLPGVIAQIKWGTVGVLGVAGMKRVVEDAIRELEL
jgi:hypothetical protein